MRESIVTATTTPPKDAAAGAAVPITAVVPVRNEERQLADCLESLRGFADVVVVDSGSTDRTCEIAAEHGATVLQFEWNGKFPKKRNWCLRTYALRTPWVFFVDADERVPEALKEELRRVLPNTPHVGFWLSYDTRFQGRLLRHGDRLRKLALFRLGAGEYERIDEDHWSRLDMEVHEHPVLNGTVGALDSPMRHEDPASLEDYLEKHRQYAAWEAHRYLALRGGARGKSESLTRRQRVKYRLLTSRVLAPAYFVFSYVFKGGFLDGRPGLTFARLKTRYYRDIRRRIRDLRRGDARRRR